MSIGTSTLSAVLVAFLLERVSRGKEIKTLLRHRNRFPVPLKNNYVRAYTILLENYCKLDPEFEGEINGKNLNHALKLFTDKMNEKYGSLSLRVGYP